MTSRMPGGPARPCAWCRSPRRRRIPRAGRHLPAGVHGQAGEHRRWPRRLLATGRKECLTCSLRKHIAPLLGECPVGSVNAQLLDSCYAELRRCRDHCGRRPRVDHHRAAGEQHWCPPWGAVRAAVAIEGARDDRGRRLPGDEPLRATGVEGVPTVSAVTGPPLQVLCTPPMIGRRPPRMIPVSPVPTSHGTTWPACGNCAGNTARSSRAAVARSSSRIR
jgi:hypothetical protein